jgi:hypothetical protein
MNAGALEAFARDAKAQGGLAGGARKSGREQEEALAFCARNFRELSGSRKREREREPGSGKIQQ